MALEKDFGTVKEVRKRAMNLARYLDRKTPLQIKEGIVRHVRDVTDLLDTLDQGWDYAPPGLAAHARDALAAAQAFRDADEDDTTLNELNRLARDVQRACAPLLAFPLSQHDHWQRWFRDIREELDRRHVEALPQPQGVDPNRLPADYVDPITIARRKKEAFDALSDEDKELIQNDPEAFERWERHGTVHPPVANEGRARVLAAKYPALKNRT